MDNDEQPHEPDEQERSEPGPVTVPVATERPDWGGAHTELIVAESPLAAEHWDERLWSR